MVWMPYMSDVNCEQNVELFSRNMSNNSQSLHQHSNKHNKTNTSGTHISIYININDLHYIFSLCIFVKF